MKYYLPLCLLVALTALLAFMPKKQTLHYKTVQAAQLVPPAKLNGQLALSNDLRIVECPSYGNTQCNYASSGTLCYNFTLCVPPVSLKSVACPNDRFNISCNSSNLGPTCSAVSTCPPMLKVVTCVQGPIGCAPNGTGSPCPSLVYCPIPD